MALSQNGGQWRYDIHQGNIPVVEVVTGVVQRVFVRATGIAEGTGDVIAEIDRNGAVHYYIPNHRGDTVLCVTNNGVSVSYLRYDAFGNSVTNIGSFSPRYTFSTKEYLDAVEVYIYAYRLYDPIAGRWTQRDPVGYQDKVNLYQFCGNNPVNSCDAFGLYAYMDDEGIIHVPIAIKGEFPKDKLELLKIAGEVAQKAWGVKGVVLEYSKKKYEDMSAEEQMKWNSLEYYEGLPNNGETMAQKIITLGPTFTERTLAHEVGHCLGLRNENIRRSYAQYRSIEYYDPIAKIHIGHFMIPRASIMTRTGYEVQDYHILCAKQWIKSGRKVLKAKPHKFKNIKK
jgi:RHS repeat-associated protein